VSENLILWEVKSLASPISNFVELKPGVKVRLHFSDHRIERRLITDPVRKVQVERESLIFYVDRIDGQPTSKMYSILSQKHAAEFAGYLEGKRYTRYEFVVVKDAAGFVPPRIDQVIPI
jgi:hypothetical protein